MRGHFAVGFRQVVRREKKVEGSAWLARLGAPARQNRRAYNEEGMNHEKHEIRSTGRFLIVIIGKKTKVESREEKVESSAWSLCSGLPK